MVLRNIFVALNKSTIFKNTHNNIVSYANTKFLKLRFNSNNFFFDTFESTLTYTFINTKLFLYFNYFYLANINNIIFNKINNFNKIYNFNIKLKNFLQNKLSKYL